MEEDILTNDEDDLEKDMREMEKEETEEEVKDKPVPKPVEEPTASDTTETYEAYKQEASLTIINTITGEVIGGFDPKRDEGIVQLGRVILNKLDKIGIASGV